MSKSTTFIGTCSGLDTERKTDFARLSLRRLHIRPDKRFSIFFIGLFVAISGSLSNGFITANLPLLQGEYGLTPSRSGMDPAAFVMANVSSNLILFKARQQYGLRLFSEIGLVLFIAVMLLASICPYL